MNNFVLIETPEGGSIILNENCVDQVRPLKDAEGVEYFQIWLHEPGPTGHSMIAKRIMGLGSLGQLLRATGYELIQVPRDCEPKQM